MSAILRVKNLTLSDTVYAHCCMFSLSRTEYYPPTQWHPDLSKITVPRSVQALINRRFRRATRAIRNEDLLRETFGMHVFFFLLFIFLWEHVLFFIPVLP